MAYVQLGDICDIVKGNIGITKAIPGDYPMVTTGEFRKSHNKFQLDTKAVLVPLVSATGHGHASIKRVHYQEGKFAFGSILAACVPKDETYSAKFLYIYFNLMKDYVLVPLMKGSANVSLTLGNLKKAKVPDVSLEKQLKIVKLYSKVKLEQDKASKLFVNQKDDIASLRQAILEEAVQGKLTVDWRDNNPGAENASFLLDRLQKEKNQLINGKKIKKEKVLLGILEEEIPYKLPNGWSWKRLGEIVTLKSGTTFNKSLEETSGDYMYVKVGAMNLPGNENYITTSNLYVNSNEKIFKSLIPERSIIFPKRGGAIATNKKRIVREPILVDLNTMAITVPISLNFMYLKYWFDSIDLWSLNNGTSVPQINNKDIAPLLLSVPPFEEQKVIAQKAGALLSFCDKIEEQIEKSKKDIEQLMQSVLREVFEGEKTI